MFNPKPLINCLLHKKIWIQSETIKSSKECGRQVFVHWTIGLGGVRNVYTRLTARVNLCTIMVKKKHLIRLSKVTPNHNHLVLNSNSWNGLFNDQVKTFENRKNCSSRCSNIFRLINVGMFSLRNSLPERLTVVNLRLTGIVSNARLINYIHFKTKNKKRPLASLTKCKGISFR